MATVTLEQLRRRAEALASRRARVVALLAREKGERDALARKDDGSLLRLAEAARAEVSRVYRWRGRGRIVLCLEKACQEDPG